MVAANPRPVQRRSGERLLNHVLGLVDVADDRHRLPDQPGVVRAVEPLEVGSGHGSSFAVCPLITKTPVTGPAGSLECARVSSPV